MRRSIVISAVFFISLALSCAPTKTSTKTDIVSGSATDNTSSTGAVQYVNGLPENVVKERIKQYMSGLRYAYNKALALEDPNIKGSVVVSFLLHPDGHVTNVVLDNCDISSSSLKQDIVKRVSHWCFPTYRGEQIKVQFPIVFRPEL